VVKARRLTFFHHRRIVVDLAHLLDDAREHSFDLRDMLSISVSNLHLFPGVEKHDTLYERDVMSIDSERKVDRGKEQNAPHP